MPDQSVVLVGDTFSSDYPTTQGVTQPDYGGEAPDLNADLFVSVISNDLSQNLRSTYFGAAQSEFGRDVAVQSDGTIAVVGKKGDVGDGSPPNGDLTVFLLDPTLTQPVNVTFVGGSARDEGYAHRCRFRRQYSCRWHCAAREPVL